MNRFEAIRVLCALACAAITASCAAKQETKNLMPPRVTGAVRLVFEGALGGAGAFSPGGMSFGPDGSLYICDTRRRCVLRLSGSGEELARFGGMEPRAERMFSPVDAAAGSGVDIFVLDGVNSRVIRLDRNLRSSATLTAAGGDNRSRFGTFAGMALDGAAGDLYLTDSSAGTVVRLDLTGNIAQVSGGFGSEKRSLRSPAGIDVGADGSLCVADPGLGAVAVSTRFGADIRLVGKGELEAPVDVVSLPDGRIAAADRRGVLVLSRAGVPEGLAGYGADREMTPRSIAHRAGKLYIGDARSRSILVYRLETAGNR